MIELFKGALRLMAAIIFLIISAFILWIYCLGVIGHQILNLGKWVITNFKEVILDDNSNQ